MLSSKQILDFVKRGKNVLIKGSHGVGKTGSICSALEQGKIKYKYYSAPTMDAFVDFVGVPTIKTGDDGSNYMELVRQPGMDDYEVIVFDEFNRAPDKVRNAVLEFIQFKSINGRVWKNLRAIFVAINPDDGYNVFRLDEAEKDRFHIHVEYGEHPDASYFSNTYGDVGTSVVNWWHSLDTGVKSAVSPRRLEYAVKEYLEGGNVEYVLPKSCNVSTFVDVMINGDPVRHAVNILKNGTQEDIDKLKQKMNTRNYLCKFFGLLSKPANEEYFELMSMVLSATTDEELTALAVDDKNISLLQYSNECKDNILKRQRCIKVLEGQVRYKILETNVYTPNTKYKYCVKKISYNPNVDKQKLDTKPVIIMIEADINTPEGLEIFKSEIPKLNKLIDDTGIDIRYNRDYLYYILALRAESVNLSHLIHVPKGK